MNSLESLEKEVAEQVSQMTVEMVLLLIDRWEQKVQEDFRLGKITAKELLYQYVQMKISLHHLSRKYERDWFYDIETQHSVESRLIQLRNKVKDARRNYYVAKQRTEPGQHGSECSCRGCRCIKGITAGSSNSGC